MTDWTKRFLRQAREYSLYSKDDGLRVGAVITKGKRGVSWGFNGLPQGVPDIEALLNDADVTAKGMKNRAALHAEENAIYFAQRDLADHHIYVYGRAPCAHCTSALIQNGITGIVWAVGSTNFVGQSSWAEDAELAKWLVAKARISCVEYPTSELDKPE